MLTLQHVLIALIGKSIGNLDFKITEGCIDSRHVPPFSMFFALNGENTDGHLYVDEAFAKGANLAIIEHPALQFTRREYPPSTAKISCLLAPAI